MEAQIFYVVRVIHTQIYYILTLISQGPNNGIDYEKAKELARAKTMLKSLNGRKPIRAEKMQKRSQGLQKCLEARG